MEDTMRVKHLNPRQGITTQGVRYLNAGSIDGGVKHLNPRQGITTDKIKVVPIGIRYEV